MRNSGLDILRLIAVFLVLGRHLDLDQVDNCFFKTWKTGGWIGVDLFFVLSGFLVSGLLFREYKRDGNVDVKCFLLRRALKIYPPFWVLIVVTVVVRIVTHEPISSKNLIGEIFFVQNYLGGLWSHTWSLAVEEHFYFGISILCFYLVRESSKQKNGKNPFRFIPGVFICVASICLVMRVGNLFVFNSFSHMWFLYGTHIRIDSLMFGVLISYFWHFLNLKSRIQWIPTSALVAAGVSLLVPAFLFPVEQFRLVSVFGVILFYLGSGFFVLAAVRFENSENRVSAFLEMLGASSYSVYLWHIPLAKWGWDVFRYFTNHNYDTFYLVFYIVGSFVFGLLMSKIVEVPILKLRDRLLPTLTSPKSS